MIYSIVLRQSLFRLVALRNLFRATRSRHFVRFCPKTVWGFCHRRGQGGVITGFAGNSYSGLFGEAKEMDFADFFKFAQPQVAIMVARQMGPAKILLFFLLQRCPATLRNLGGIDRSRYFERFWQKSISHFWRRRGGVGSPRDLSEIATPDFFAEVMEWGSVDFFKFELPLLYNYLVSTKPPAKYCRWFA